MKGDALRRDPKRKNRNKARASKGKYGFLMEEISAARLIFRYLIYIRLVLKYSLRLYLSLLMTRS